MLSALFYLGIVVKVGVLVGRDFYLRENIWNGNLVWGCFMQISLDRRRRRILWKNSIQKSEVSWISRLLSPSV